ncbi:glycosyltransferase family 61 protein [Paenibacillus sp. y28]|uniref:glycosyltransferase family 61 protein n=1 Tax=Paenibacillus sp. y28 TaxID=3129110 RepID=UPI003015E8B1
MSDKDLQTAKLSVVEPPEPAKPEKEKLPAFLPTSAQPVGKYVTAKEWSETEAGKVPGAEYTEFYFDPPFHLPQSKSIHGKASFPERTIPQHTVSVAVIPAGRVWGKYGFVITNDNRLLMDVSADIVDDAQHSVFHRWESHPLSVTEETVAVLTLNYSENYYHWLYDVIARLGWLKESGVAIDKYIVNRNGRKPFQEETLQLLGIPPEKRIETHEQFHLQAARLVVPSHTWRSGFPKCSFNFLRNSFLPLRDESFHVPERIYIRRTHRGVINEEAVLQLLKDHGFTAVRLENMSFLQQVQMFACAKAIVAPHGAGLTNLTFCAPGTKVIELFENGYTPDYFWRIAGYAGLDYYELLGLPNEAPDYNISETDLLAILKNAGLA